MKCLNCQNSVNDYRNEFCSAVCYGKYQRTKVIENWKLGIDSGVKAGNRLKTAIRDYLLKKAAFKCIRCSWDKINPITGKSPLEINHIDGDSLNNKEENLEVICPNCHSLTPTWKALNKGKGNKERLRYSKL